MDLFDLLFRVYPSYVSVAEIRCELGVSSDMLDPYLRRLAEQRFVVLSEGGDVCLSEHGFRSVCGDRVSSV